MTTTGRISLGAAFLSKTSSSGTSMKCILHAEFLLDTKQYLLTKITYAHDKHYTLGLKSSETFCDTIVDVLSLLSKRVAAKHERGYGFDEAAMQILSEEDETWDGFQLIGSHDPEIDDVVMMNANYTNRNRRTKVKEETVRRMTPMTANRIRRNLAARSISQKAKSRQ